jgi:hypothetical protein
MSTPETVKWKGKKAYRCRLCAFDTFDKAIFEDHFRKVHAPLEVIEARQAKPASLDGMTRDELNAEAANYGIEDATNTTTYPTKADVIAAIEAVKKGN